MEFKNLQESGDGIVVSGYSLWNFLTGTQSLILEKANTAQCDEIIKVNKSPEAEVTIASFDHKLPL